MEGQYGAHLEVPYLRAWRLYRGWSQMGLGVRAGVHYVTISLVESGAKQVRRNTVEKLARGLGISVEMLLHMDPNAEETLL